MTADEAMRCIESDDEARLAEAVAREPALVSATSELGDTLLHEGCRQKKVWAVRLLLRHGAAPNARGDLGFTALHCAVRDCPAAKAEPIVALLMEHGADPTLRDIAGFDVFENITERHEIWDDPTRVLALLRSV